MIPTRMTATPAMIVIPLAVKTICRCRSTSGTNDPMIVESPMAIAKFRAIPIAATPNPKKICARPKPTPRPIISKSNRGLASA